jgi:hypothetical protein
MNGKEKFALKAAVFVALAFAGHPTLAEPGHEKQSVQLAQAQGQPAGEVDSGAPADQPAAAERRRMGPGMKPGMMDDEDRKMDPEMMMRMKRMHGDRMGRMGPGMRGGMIGGQGMMGGMCAMMMAQGDKDLSADQVRAILEGQIAWTGNKRLKVGAVEQKDEETYVADIVTVDDSLVQQVQVDRNTGAMRPVN